MMARSPWHTLAAGALGALLLAGPAAARTYTVVTLRTFGDVTPIGPNSINESGDVTGVAAQGDPQTNLAHVGFLYVGGTLGTLSNLPGTHQTLAVFINDAGDVAGWSSSDYFDSHAFLYRGGVLTALDPILGTVDSRVAGMNDLGQLLIVGTTASANWSGIYDVDDGSLTTIEPPDGYPHFSAEAMNDAGDVVGMAHPTTGYIRGYLRQAGVMAPLATFPDSLITYPTAINDAGQVAGYGYPTSGPSPRAVVSDGAGPLTDLGTLPGDLASQAWAINAHGVVVGSSGYAPDATPLRAFVYENGVMQDLNALIDPALGVTLRSATAVNDRGQIAGWGESGTELTDYFAFVLTPTVCGNGVREFGEACDDGAANSTDRCCAADCSLVDGDGDGLCDAADPCTTTAPDPITRAKLVAGRLFSPPGDDWLRFTGTLSVPPTPAIDPDAKGIRILVTGTAPEPLLDATLPAGSRWTASATGKAWRYRDPSGSVAGIVRMTVRQVGSSPGVLRFALRGDDGDYAALATGGVLSAMVVIDAPAAMGGQCAAVSFAGPAPAPSCMVHGNGAALRCN